jgi:hypothetical protein
MTGGKPMSTRTLEQLIEQARTLTSEERRQLIARLEKDERNAELRRIQGKYVGMKVGSDAFAAGKAEEIELEHRPKR